MRTTSGRCEVWFFKRRFTNYLRPVMLSLPLCFKINGRMTGVANGFYIFSVTFVCLFVCLLLAQQLPSGPGPPHSQGF